MPSRVLDSLFVLAPILILVAGFSAVVAGIVPLYRQPLLPKTFVLIRKAISTLMLPPVILSGSVPVMEPYWTAMGTSGLTDVSGSL